MADYKKFFKRENFIASMQAAKERKQKWEREVQQKWDELHNELEATEKKIALYKFNKSFPYISFI